MLLHDRVLTGADLSNYFMIEMQLQGVSMSFDHSFQLARIWMERQ